MSKKIEWDESLSDTKNRRKRFEDIIKNYSCKTTKDCIDKYIEIYSSEIDYENMSDVLNIEKNGYANKAIDSIENLAKDEFNKRIFNKDGIYYIIDGEDEDDIFYSKFSAIFQEANIIAKELCTIQLTLDSKSCSQLLPLLEKQFSNIIEISTKVISKKRKKVIITYSKNIKLLRPSIKTGDHYYSPNDLMETVQAIKTEMKNEKK